MTRSLSKSLSLLIVLGTAGLASADEKKPDEQPSESEKRLQQALDWLPFNTETIVAAQGPFEIPTVDCDDAPSPLAEMLESWALFPFQKVRNGKYLQTLAGQNVLLALEGARHFRAPFHEGLGPYDGCHILIFDDEFATIGGELLTAMKKDANRIHHQERQEILAFDEQLIEDRWTFFVARPRPNVLLCGTDRAFVCGVLWLMDSKKTRPALPKLADLPEWKHVNTKARFWAIRHFDPGNASNDPTTPLTTRRGPANNSDPQAIGFTFSFDPAQEPPLAIVRYLSLNKDRQAVLKRQWNSESMDPMPTLIDVGDDTTQMSFPLRDGRIEGYFDGILLMSLGHAVFI